MLTQVPPEDDVRLAVLTGSLLELGTDPTPALGPLAVRAADAWVHGLLIPLPRETARRALPHHERLTGAASAARI